MDSNTNKTYEQEIDLKDLMFSVFRKWRPILLVAIAVGLLMGGYKTVKGFGQMKDPEYVKTNQESYEISLKQYEATKNRLEKEVKNIQTNIEDYLKYKDESILMNINPYDEYVAVTTLYIATDYQVMPNMAYQNPNKATSILRAYMSIAQNGEMYNYVRGKMDNSLSLRYLQELVKLEPDYDNNMLSITVIGENEKRSREVMGYIMESIEASYEGVTQSVGAHQVNVIDSSELVTVDLELDKQQKELSESMVLLDTSLTEKTKNLSELKEPVNSLLSKTSVIKGAVKYAVLGGVLGGFMAVFFACVAFLMSDNLVSEKEIRRRYGVAVLGTFKRGGKKRMFAFVDSWLDRLEGVSKRELEDNQTCDVIAANVQNYAGEAKTILLIGTTGSEDLETVQKGLNGLLPGITLAVGGNPCKEALAIKETASCDAVILVERRNASSFSGMEQELDLINSLDKKVLGCVVL